MTNPIEREIDDHRRAIADLEARLEGNDERRFALREEAYLDRHPIGDRPIPSQHLGTPPNYVPPHAVGKPYSRTRFYKDKLRGKWLGVCSGIADYIGVDVLWVRLVMILSTFVIFPINLIAYLVVAILAPNRPDGLYENREDQRFWQQVRANSSRSTKDVRSKLRDIDRRIADIETHFVSSNRRLSDEIDALR